jgi:hypothetical protein
VSEKTIPCNTICRFEYAAFEYSGRGWQIGVIRQVIRRSIRCAALKA